VYKIFNTVVGGELKILSLEWEN